MSTSGVPAGWHPDPSDPSGSFLRWWDGTQWTAQTQPNPQAAPSFPAQPSGPMTYGLPHQQGQSAQSGQPPPYGQGQFPQAQGPMYGRRMGGMRGMGGPQSGSASFGQRNQASLTAIVVSIIYVVLAVTAHFVLLGIFPALMCVRAFQRKELLAPLAAVAAGVAIVAAVLAYAH